ncbi:ATP synthase subunit I [Candidatus Thiodiazotropha sp. LNASS1]|uniref:ATP synthase subunit I n=1 Tax=Candidatus Thiodiazotropha sp. LNASS1 TaxID=3096260 RepID=UPI0028082C0C|nr:ATP synthase subunit I [Candidatus Thiodiazotropha sp. (ex Cardiolucina cf. quadrata)]
MQLTGNSQIRTIVALQLGAAVVVGLILLAFGKTFALSGFIGGLIAAVANGYFAHRSFTHYRAQDPQKIAGRMFGAEIQKLIITGLMFGLAIVTITPLSIGALLGSYLFVQVAVPLIVLVIEDRQHS